MPAKLILTRKGEMVNRRQPFKVLIDGKEAGAIKNDDSQEFVLEPGTHDLQLKINWMSSPVHSITLEEGKNKFLRVRSAMKFFTPLYIMLLAGVLFPLIFRLSKIPIPAGADYIRIILVFPAVLYWLYYITISRKKFVVVEEDKSNPFA